jgi:hypothetical protein
MWLIVLQRRRHESELSFPRWFPGRVGRRVGNGCCCRRLRLALLGCRDRRCGRGRRGGRGLGLCGVVATDKRQRDDGNDGEARAEQGGLHGNSFENGTTDALASTRLGRDRTVESHREPQCAVISVSPHPARPVNYVSDNGGRTGLDARDSLHTFPILRPGNARSRTHSGFNEATNGCTQHWVSKTAPVPSAKINRRRGSTNTSVATRPSRLTAQSTKGLTGDRDPTSRVNTEASR